MIFLKHSVLSAICFLSCFTTSLAFDGVEVFESDKSAMKVLLFLSQSCPCSGSHVEHLNSLAQGFPEVSFIGVITDRINNTNRKMINDYYKSKAFKFPLVDDSEQKLVKQYGALKTPHSTLLKKDVSNGYKVLYQGGVTNRRDYSRSTKKFLQENLAAISRGEPAVYQQGKSLGCYIRRL